MRVLVVEDEPDLLRVVAATLREDGYAVDTASDGEDALFKATAWDYDAVLLDVMLPKLDGWSVLKRMRAVKRTPVLMLTARDTVQDRVRELRVGVHRLVEGGDRLVRRVGVSSRPEGVGGRRKPVAEVADRMFRLPERGTRW